MTVFNVCLLCGGLHNYDGVGCPMAQTRWRAPFASVQQAMAAHVGSDEVVVGDPTSFRSNDIDLGWDLEMAGGLAEARVLREYEEPWQNRMVKHPQTGFMVKVGSLPPDLQDRFRPRNLPPEELVKIKHHTVPGGVIVNKKIAADEYQSKTRDLEFLHDIKSKETSSVFSLFKDGRGFSHLFRLMFEPGEFQHGVNAPHRAHGIVQVGAFKDFSYAKNYAVDMAKGAAHA